MKRKKEIAKEKERKKNRGKIFIRVRKLQRKKNYRKQNPRVKEMRQKNGSEGIFLNRVGREEVKINLRK